MSVITVSWKRSKTITILAVVQFLIAVFLVSVAFILPSLELQIAIGSLGITIATIAFSGMINTVDKHKIDQILDKLSELEDLQKEIQSEQKEQASSGPPIVASLQAMSQYYMDYIAKQKESENEKS